jgi:hypothetical protein
MNSLEVTLASSTLTDDAVPLCVIQFYKHNTEDMMFVELPEQDAILPFDKNILVLVDAIAKDINDEPLASVPPHVRFRLTLEFEKTTYPAPAPMPVFP